MKIDADEKELLASVERGEWKSAGGGKRERTRFARWPGRLALSDADREPAPQVCVGPPQRGLKSSGFDSPSTSNCPDLLTARCSAAKRRARDYLPLEGVAWRNTMWDGSCNSLTTRYLADEAAARSRSHREAVWRR